MSLHGSMAGADAAFAEAFRSAYQTFVLGQWQPLFDLIEDHFVLRVDADELLVSGAGTWLGKEGFKAHMAAVLEDFDPERVVFEDCAVAAGRVAAWTVFHAVHRPSQARVAIRIHHVWKHDRGRIIAADFFVDREDTARQILGEARQTRRPSQLLPSDDRTGDANATIVGSALSGWAQADFAPFWRALDEDVVWRCAASPRDLPFGGTYRGKAEVAVYWERFNRAFQIVEYSPGSLVRCGPEIGHVSQTRLRPMSGGEPFATVHMAVWGFYAGRVASYVEYLDLPVIKAALSAPR